MATATKTAPKAAPKKEKRDFKQELLEFIDKTHGLSAAVAMEPAIKAHDKKIEDYILNQGGSMPDAAKMMGIDIGMKNSKNPQPSVPQMGDNSELLQNLFPLTMGAGQAQPLPQITQPIPQAGIPQANMLPSQGSPQEIPSQGIPQGIPQGTPQAQQQAGRNPPQHAFSFPTSTQDAGWAIQLLSLLAGAGLPNKPGESQAALERLELSKERLGFERDMEERRLGAEKRKGVESTRNTIYNSGAELTDEDLKDPDIAKIVVPLIKQNRLEPLIDEKTGKRIYSVPPKGVIETTRKEVAKINLKKKELEKELVFYFSVGDSLPTADGLGRFAQGAELYLGSKFQDDTQGAMAAQLDALNKRLRVKLVRAAGDVGNLNIVEQAAAEKLLYNFSDSTQLRELKKATLLDLTKAVDDGNKNNVKDVINKWSTSMGGGGNNSVLPPDKAARLKFLREKAKGK